MSVGSAAFVVFVCAMCGALVIGWLNASAAKASATNYAPGVGAFVTGVIFGFVLGGIVRITPLVVKLGHEAVEIERRRDHRHALRSLGWPRPLLLRPIPVELDPV